MPQVIPPAPRPIKTDIELFARAYFNIELTSYQMEIIAMVASGKPIGDIHSPKQSGKTVANKVILAYLQAGIKTNGRARVFYTKGGEEAHTVQDGSVLKDEEILFARIPEAALKAFADALAERGVKTDNDHKIAGTLEATKYHLEDMRKIAKVKE